MLLPEPGRAAFGLAANLSLDLNCILPCELPLTTFANISWHRGHRYKVASARHLLAQIRCPGPRPSPPLEPNFATSPLPNPLKKVELEE